MDKKIELGETVKCTISGFTGVATSRCERLYGQTRIEVTWKSAPDGKVNEHWFDEAQLVAVPIEAQA